MVDTITAMAPIAFDVEAGPCYCIAAFGVDANVQLSTVARIRGSGVLIAFSDGLGRAVLAIVAIVGGKLRLVDAHEFGPYVWSSTGLFVVDAKRMRFVGVNRPQLNADEKFEVNVTVFAVGDSSVQAIAGGEYDARDLPSSGEPDTQEALKELATWFKKMVLAQ